ncbi:hypothetical protein [Bacillus mycoides]|uniref:hypothetical protein n=1 Tax=Bacillus mycoides TaxID=1405 RepID=UPI001C00E324|nr:hypothetical protein [Bacillus mycoides]
MKDVKVTHSGVMTIVEVDGNYVTYNNPESKHVVESLLLMLDDAEAINLEIENQTK